VVCSVVTAVSAVRLQLRRAPYLLLLRHASALLLLLWLMLLLLLMLPLTVQWLIRHCISSSTSSSSSMLLLLCCRLWRACVRRRPSYSCYSWMLCSWLWCLLLLLRLLRLLHLLLLSNRLCSLWCSNWALLCNWCCRRLLSLISESGTHV
jgi:hypothetical protein